MSIMADNRQASCEERIGQELSDRAKQIADIWKRLDAAQEDDEFEAGYEELNYLPLSLEHLTVYKILLSTGGPADWIEVTVDREGEITRLEYVFQDWFDGARRTVDRQTEEGQALERFASYIIEGYDAS